MIIRRCTYLSIEFSISFSIQFSPSRPPSAPAAEWGFARSLVCFRRWSGRGPSSGLRSGTPLCRGPSPGRCCLARPTHEGRGRASHQQGLLQQGMHNRFITAGRVLQVHTCKARPATSSLRTKMDHCSKPHSNLVDFVKSFPTRNY